MLQMTCYHGSDVEDLASLNPSPRGTLGGGIYFTLVADEASEYGELVYQATVTLQKPWVIEIDHESDKAVELDFDSPSVEAVLSLPQGMTMLTRAREGDGLYGYELQCAVRAQGYDGIVATYPDGSAEVVAFFPGQVGDLQLFVPAEPRMEPSW